MERERRLRWAATCSACSIELPARSQAIWDDEAKAARCVVCVPTPVTAGGGVSHHGLATAAKPIDAVTSTPSPIEPGQAGASARREYERRAKRERAARQAVVDEDAEWRARAKADHPFLGRVALAFIPTPQIGPESPATTAWKTGERGEQRVAVSLERSSAIVLHDRRVPRTKANIDHIAVAATGVYVIDSKKYTGRIELRDIGTLRRPDPRLFVRGRDRTKLIAGVDRQCDVVRAALGDLAAEVEIHGVLCFVDGDWNSFRPRPITIRGVTSIWPRGLRKLLDEPGSLHADRAAVVATRLAETLRPA